MNIGFDFDKVLVDYPPVVPASLINLCYRNGLAFFRPQKNGLTYRVPGEFEKRIRLLTHFQLLRPPLKKNISVIKKLHDERRHKLFLVSGRFGFLEDVTETLLDTYDLRKYFQGIYFNYKNEQPHEFKERVLREERITTFVDDDLALLTHLAKTLPRVSLFWISNSKMHAPSRITKIQDLSTFYNIYLTQYDK